MKADHWSMVVFWNEGSMAKPSVGPDVGLDYTDEPVPPPPPGPSGYQDPVVLDDDMLQDGNGSSRSGRTRGGPLGPGPGPPYDPGGDSPDLPSGDIDFQHTPGGNPPPHYPGGGASVPVPDDSDSSMELTPDQGFYIRRGGPPDAPGAKQAFANPDQITQPPPHVPSSAPQPIAPTPKHPHFPLFGVMRPPSPRNVPLTRSTGSHPDDVGPKAKLRFSLTGNMQPPPTRVATPPKQSAPESLAPVAPVVTLPGQGVQDKKGDPPIDWI